MAQFTMDASLINPFIKATVDTFKMMASLSVQPKKPILEHIEKIDFDISGIIGLGGTVKGSIALSFNQEEALKIVSKFMGEEMKELNADVADAVGELANIIAGYAKKDLKDVDVEISLPSVIMGTGHQVYEAKDSQSIIIPFESDLGRFDMGVTMKDGK